MLLRVFFKVWLLLLRFISIEWYEVEILVVFYSVLVCGCVRLRKKLNLCFFFFYCRWKRVVYFKYKIMRVFFRLRGNLSVIYVEIDVLVYWYWKLLLIIYFILFNINVKFRSEEFVWDMDLEFLLCIWKM